MTVAVAPYGSWKSPITSDLIVAGTVGLSQVRLDGDDVYWIEQRPSEGGRNVVVRRTPAGRITDVTPGDFNARTRVHEYGGGAYVVADRTVWFSNFADQRLYRQDAGRPPEPITPQGDLRYADADLDRAHQRLVCVREDHTAPGREAVNTLVDVDLDGRREVRVLVSGNDFYASPRLSPDGQRLAWVTWNHPNMPWDGTELWVGELAADGSIRTAQRVAGGTEESVSLPQWSPRGLLYFISDRSGWWNLYRWRPGHLEQVVALEGELAGPPWVFGMSTYAFESEQRIICEVRSKGIHRLARLDPSVGRLETIETPYTTLAGFTRASAGRVVTIAGSPTQPAGVIVVDPPSGAAQVLRLSADVRVDPGYLSIPQPIEFPTEHGLTAHAFFYAPANRDYVAPQQERPPLLVHVHGGPTGAASTALDLGIQYWTSRGFAVADVNYGGSAGFGRAYRQRLNGQWGLVDVQDCVNAARYLAGRKLVDPDRLAISGGSAGGYTVLRTLTSSDLFKAGASHFGISDLEVFHQDTHKFEAHYDHSLLGPWPHSRHVYRERSPIHSIDRIAAPVILFQGLEDRIVPPNQAEMIVEALRRKGVPVAYVAFEGEQHGFRRAENIKRALDGELYFYGKVFRFDPAGPVQPVTIENLETAPTA